MKRITTFLLSAGLAVSAVASSKKEKPTDFEKNATTVFENGKGTHPAYRIPALTTAKDGTVLAFIEGRANMHDHAHNDVLLRRSSDNGKTWGNHIIVRKNKHVLVNPSPVVLDNGEVLMFIEQFPDKFHAREGKHHGLLAKGFGDKAQKFLLFRSKDNGKTWSEPEDLTAVARGPEGGLLTSGSPAASIQLKNGQYKGRILTPIYCTMYTDAKIRYNYIGAVYSDDMGKSWKRSDFAENPVPIEKLKNKNGSCNEFHFAETAEGHVVINARGNRSGRFHSLSTDGGSTWSKLKPVNASRRNNNAMIGLNSEGKTFLVQSFSAHSRNRSHGVILTSQDGEKWQKVIDITSKSTPFGYSAMTVLKNGNIGLIYECFTGKSKTSKFVEIPRSSLK